MTEDEHLFEILGILDAARRKAQEAYAQAQAGSRRGMWKEVLACELLADEALARLNAMVDPDPCGERPDLAVVKSPLEDDGFVLCTRGTLSRMLADAERTV